MLNASWHNGNYVNTNTTTVHVNLYEEDQVLVWNLPMLPSRYEFRVELDCMTRLVAEPGPTYIRSAAG